MYKHLIILFFALVLSKPSFSQDEEINVAGFVFMDYQGVLPESIRSSKTIVLVNTSDVNPELPFQKTVEPMVNQAHKVFADAGIDVVGYYNLKQVLAGTDSQYGFSEAWKKREIENIIILSKLVFQQKKKEVTRFVLLATTFNGLPSLFSNNQLAWKTQDKDFDKALSKLASAANKYEKNNLLVSEQPEYFDDVKMVRGQHVEGYLTDLDFGKMAVPKFAIVEIPNPKPDGLINNLIAKQVEESNSINVQNNQVLEEKMKSYDFEYEFVDSDISESELSKMGYSYKLLNLYSAGVDIKRLLNYKINEDRDTYTTQIFTNGNLTIRSIPANGLVYKYYIKHLKTGNVYLGSKWDADETWSKALDHMLYNVKVEMHK